MTITNPTPPLTPAVFHIILVLSSGEQHGYGIMKQVEADSQGKIKYDQAAVRSLNYENHHC